MKRIIDWLRMKLSQPSTSIATDQPSDAVIVDSDNLEQDYYAVETSCGADVPNLIDKQGKGDLIPDIYADVHVDIRPDLVLAFYSLKSMSGFSRALQSTSKITLNCATKGLERICGLHAVCHTGVL